MRKVNEEKVLKKKCPISFLSKHCALQLPASKFSVCRRDSMEFEIKETEGVVSGSYPSQCCQLPAGFPARNTTKNLASWTLIRE
jgi:hypothetical protein